MSTDQSNGQLVRASDHLQMIPIAQAKEWYHAFAEFTQSILKKDLDYGVIPGTPKPSLLKAGAEKLRFAYGLTVEFTSIENTVDLDRLFVDYTYKCTIKSKAGQTLAECEGNCNSMEAKFGYVWMPISELPEGTDITRLKSRVQGKKITEFEFAIEKKETGGQYGKPAEYWQNWEEAIQGGRAKAIKKKSKAGKEMNAWELDDQVTLYRVPNPDVVGLKNTIMKMAQKRAFVGAILLATGASEYFTQDIEDMEINGHIYSNEAPAAGSHIEDAVIVEEVKTPPPPPAEPRKQKLSDAGFQKAVKRIEEGEIGVGAKLKETFDLSSAQLIRLEELEKPVSVGDAEVATPESVQDDPPF